jgi:MFS family permease
MSSPDTPERGRRDTPSAVVASPTDVESNSRLGLVRRSPAFGLLFIATAGSGFGTYLAAIALTVHVYDQTKSGVWVAALLIADFLPIVVIGLLLGPLVDRLSRRWLMIVSDIVRFGVFAGLVFVNDPAAIVALAGVAGVATGFFRPAAYAGLPNLVPDEELTNANSLLQTIETLAWMLGPVVAGIMLTTWEPRVPYAVNAVTFLVSAGLVAGISEKKLRSQESLTRGHWRDVADGIRLVLTSAPLRTVLIVWNIALIGSAAVNVAEVVFAKEALNAGDIGFGVLVAASGVGLAVGSYLAAPVLGKMGLRRHYAAAIAVMGIGSAAAAVSPTIWVAVPFVILGAAGNGGAIIANQILVQRGAPDRFRGRALATIMSCNYAFLGLAMAGAGILTDIVGPRWVWFGSGAVHVFAAVVAVALTRWLPVTSRQEEEVLVAHAEAAASALAPAQPAAAALEPEPFPPLAPPPEPVYAPEPFSAPEPVSAPEPAVAANHRAEHAGLERLAVLLEEIERRRKQEASRRSSS